MSKTSEKLAPLVREIGWSYNLIIMDAMCDFKNKCAIHRVMLRKPIG